jgi:hypothetical protein
MTVMLSSFKMDELPEFNGVTCVAENATTSQFECPINSSSYPGTWTPPTGGRVNGWVSQWYSSGTTLMYNFSAQTKLLDETVALANLGTPADSTRVWVPDAAPESTCSSGTGTYAVRANGAWSCGGSGGSGPTSIKSLGYYMAAGCDGTAAASGFNLPTSNAPTPNCAGTTIRYGTLDFDESGTQNAFVRVLLPSDWQSSSSTDMDLTISSTATTGTETISVAAACPANPSGSVTFNTAKTASPTMSGTAGNTQTVNLTGIDMTGCTAGKEAYFQIKRTDTNSGTMSLFDATLSISRSL